MTIYVTAKEVAAKTPGISEQLIRSWGKEGRIPAILTGRKKMRFPLEKAVAAVEGIAVEEAKHRANITRVPRLKATNEVPDAFKRYKPTHENGEFDARAAFLRKIEQRRKREGGETCS